jgi:hypothetical protein
MYPYVLLKANHLQPAPSGQAGACQAKTVHEPHTEHIETLQYARALQQKYIRSTRSAHSSLCAANSRLVITGSLCLLVLFAFAVASLQRRFSHAAFGRS